MYVDLSHTSHVTCLIYVLKAKGMGLPDSTPPFLAVVGDGMRGVNFASAGLRDSCCKPHCKNGR